MVFSGRIVLTTVALSMGGFAQAAYADVQTGVASYYWQGKGTASGERFNANALTAAHRSLPFNTKVQVTNLRNGRSVVVRINDRGPFVRGRIIDVSKAAAGELGFSGHGVTKVSVKVIDAAEAETVAVRAPEKEKGRTQVASADAARTQVASLPEAAPETNTMPNGGWTLVPPPSATQATSAQTQDAPTP